MKNALGLIVVISVILFLSGCGGGKKATFGEGDTRFSVELVKGNCLIHDKLFTGLASHKYTGFEGEPTLKLCNSGEKEVAFVLDEEAGGILLKFREEDILAVKPMWLASEVGRTPLESTGGFINLVPGTCPTYSFTFESSIQTDYSGEEGGLSKDAFKNAKCYFYIGDYQFGLDTTTDLTMPTAEEIQTMKEYEERATGPVITSQLV